MSDFSVARIAASLRIVQMSSLRSLSRFVSCLWLLLAVGCGESSPADDDRSSSASCAPGRLGCTCDENDTCEGSLTCLSSLCVDAGDLVNRDHCQAGSLGCDCDEDECDPGLTCLSQLCVDAGDLDGGSLGSGGTGSGGASGSGGSNDGAGGDESSAGEGGTGGTTGGSDGGGTHSGGSGDGGNGAGGDFAAGGNSGSGGDASTGGAPGGGGTGGTSPGACNEIVHPVRGTLGLPTLRGVEALGDLVYASAGKKIHVIDISDEDAPVVVGDLEVLSTAASSELYLVQGYAVLLDGDVLRVVDVGAPTAPTLASSYTVAGINSAGIASDGQYLYVTTDTELQALALENGSLSFVGKIPTAARASDLAVSGGYAYAIISSAVHVFDVSTPATPAFAGAYADAQNYFTIIGLTKDYLFIQASTSTVGARALSLADPTMPASVTEWSWGTKVVQVGERLLMGSGSGVTELENGDQFGAIRAVGASFSASTGLAVTGDRVVTAGSNQITVITRSRMPAFVAFGPDERVLASALHQNILYYATTTSSTSSTGVLKMLDFTEPTAPEDLGTFEGSASIGRRIVVANGRLYAARSVSSASTEYVLSTFSLDDPTAPKLLGSTRFSGGVSSAGFSVQDDLFVGVRGSAFTTMNMTDPNAVSILGVGALAGTAWAVARHGNYAIVTTDGQGTARYTDVFLITNPASPVRVVHGTGAIGGTLYREGDTLYAFGSSSVGVYDISSLPAITELGRGSIPTNATSRTPQASKFSHYLSTGRGALVDVSDPTNPTFVLSERLGGRGPYHISHALDGYHLLMGDHGWVVVDYCP